MHDLLSLAVRPCDVTSARASLVVDAAVCRVQCDCSCLMLPPWLSIIILHHLGLHHVADVDSQWCLRSVSTSELIIPTTCISTVGNRAFLVAMAQTWNSLPADITSSLSLSVCKSHLKTVLCSWSYPVCWLVSECHETYHSDFIRCSSSLWHYAT